MEASTHKRKGVSNAVSLTKKHAGLLVAVAALAIPAASLAAGQPGGPSNHGKQNAASHKPNSSQKGKSGSHPTQAKSPGWYCQGESKKHTAHGDKGTPFSQCVTAMAKLAKGTATSPKAACAGMSKKHVKGQKGTPFSVCVQAGKKLMASQHR
jgi:hypothetical protein